MLDKYCHISASMVSFESCLYDLEKLNLLPFVNEESILFHCGMFVETNTSLFVNSLIRR